MHLCIYASMHPMQLYINFYVFSYISLCIYAPYASYASVYKLLCIFLYKSMHLCIYASYASYAAVYKLLCIFLYKSMHPMYINLYVFSYISLCIYASNVYNLYVFSYVSLCIYASYASYAAEYKLVCIFL